MFRVKFYVTDPSRLHEELTRYHVYLQVRKDIAEGRLSAPFSTLCLLTSYVVQAVLGDFDFDTCRPGYLTQFKVKIILRHEPSYGVTFCMPDDQVTLEPLTSSQ